MFKHITRIHDVDNPSQFYPELPLRKITKTEDESPKESLASDAAVVDTSGESYSMPNFCDEIDNFGPLKSTEGGKDDQLTGNNQVGIYSPQMFYQHST